MEKLKPLTKIREPDVRQKMFVRNLPGGKFRPITLKDFHSRIKEIELHNGVPEEIRNHFQTARHLAIYAFFYYPFHMTAELQAYASTEYALRKRAGVAGLTLRPLLRRAVAEGWIRDDGFELIRNRKEASRAYREERKQFGLEVGHIEEKDEVDRYCKVLCEVLPKARNWLAHGSSELAPGSASTLKICADLINQLFEKHE